VGFIAEPARRRLRFFSAALACIAALGSGGAALADPPLHATPGGRPLQLTFSDDFNSFRRYANGSGVWRTVYGDMVQRGTSQRTLPSNGELELYVDPDLSDARGSLGLDPFSVQGGVLEITAEPSPPDIAHRIGGYRYISGLITTQPSFSQTYGYFEMRARLPAGKGLWPAFWLLPADQTWPPEIDVMESIGDPGHIYMTSHSKAGTQGVEARIAPSGFHIFAVSWDANQLIFYIDGEERGRVPTPYDMHKAMFILANLAVGGTWPGAPDRSTRFPATYAIDYIRAYKFAR
jgi:beta-glucanase (GH16 family)